MRNPLCAVAICDDTPMEAELLSIRLEEYSINRSIALSVRWFNDAEALENALDAGQRFDVIFMDIFLPKQDGISFIRRQREKGRRLPVVFLSNLQERSDEQRALGAIDCIVKPIQKAQLATLMDKLWQPAGQEPEQEHWVIHEGGRFEIGEITYVELCGKSARCHLAGGDTTQCGMDNDALKHWLSQDDVVKLTDKIAVCFSAVDSFSAKNLVLRDGTVFKIPWRKRKTLSAQYMAYAARHAGRK